jgi:hypothetical protein
MGNSRTFDPQGERRMIYGYMLGIVYSVLRECKRRRIDFAREWSNGNTLDIDLRLLGDLGATKNFVCIDDVISSMLHILDLPHVRTAFHLTSPRPISGKTMWRCIAKALKIDGIRFVGEDIANPTQLERNVMSYTAPFLPYTVNPDPVWLLTNTDRAMGRAHARVPMTETVLTGLLHRFMAEEVSARLAPIAVDDTYPASDRMLAGV